MCSCSTASSRARRKGWRSTKSRRPSSSPVSRRWFLLRASRSCVFTACSLRNLREERMSCRSRRQRALESCPVERRGEIGWSKDSSSRRRQGSHGPCFSAGVSPSTSSNARAAADGYASLRSSPPRRPPSLARVPRTISASRSNSGDERRVNGASRSTCAFESAQIRPAWSISTIDCG